MQITKEIFAFDFTKNLFFILDMLDLFPTPDALLSYAFNGEELRCGEMLHQLDNTKWSLAQDF